MTIFVSTPYSLESQVLKLCILHHANVQMCKLLRTKFYVIKVVPLTTLAALKIDIRDIRDV